jgi:hypothetical protein
MVFDFTFAALTTMLLQILGDLVFACTIRKTKTGVASKR